MRSQRSLRSTNWTLVPSQSKQGHCVFLNQCSWGHTSPSPHSSSKEHVSSSSQWRCSLGHCQTHLQKTAHAVINDNSIDWDPIWGPNSPSNQHSCLLCFHWYLRWISSPYLATSYLKLSIQWLPSPNLKALLWWRLMFHISVLPSTASKGFGTYLAGSYHKSDLQHPSHSIFYYLQELLYSFCCLLIFKQEKLRNTSALQTHSCEGPGLYEKRECSCTPAPCLRNHEYSVAGLASRRRSGKGKGSQKVSRKNQCSNNHYHLVSPFYGRGYNVFLL